MKVDLATFHCEIHEFPKSVPKSLCNKTLKGESPTVRIIESTASSSDDISCDNVYVN